MTTVLSREEEETREPEITLSTASLLGIFVGLVLVCGVFFGFGYSVGRRATVSVDSAATSTPSATTEDADGQGAAKNSGGDAQDAGSTPAPVPDASANSGEAPAEAPARTSRTATLPVVQAPAASPRDAEARRPKSQTAANTPAPPATAGAGHTMVQVAAVVHQEDADVLVSALRKLGYSAVVRSGAPQDKLLHVQVGPFSTRAEAIAIKQKLAGNGYNAILKQ
jgi:DedD protein